jgi:hypothetical protein
VVNVRNAYKTFVRKVEEYWVENPKGGDLWEDLGVCRRASLNICERNKVERCEQGSVVISSER